MAGAAHQASDTLSAITFTKYRRLSCSRFDILSIACGKPGLAPRLAPWPPAANRFDGIFNSAFDRDFQFES
jgi:hypothetical protein